MNKEEKKIKQLEKKVEELTKENGLLKKRTDSLVTMSEDCLNVACIEKGRRIEATRKNSIEDALVGFASVVLTGIILTDIFDKLI